MKKVYVVFGSCREGLCGFGKAYATKEEAQKAIDWAEIHKSPDLPSDYSDDFVELEVKEKFEEPG